MKTVQDIYEAYRIMPSLQLHQLRVAAVAQALCENMEREIDTESTVLAALFHDMGNIIKSDLSLFPDFVEPEGQAHWQLIKDDVIRSYGKDAHTANVAIAEKVGLSSRVVGLIDAMSFSRMEAIRDGNDEELKVLEYADMRTGPHGILSAHARVEEGRVRFLNKYPDRRRSDEEWTRLMDALLDIERHLFSEATLSPEDITEQGIAPRFEQLRMRPVPSA